MSFFKMLGDALGSGTFTIKSPNSNNNRQLLLPDQDGILVTDAAGKILGWVRFNGQRNVTDSGASVVGQPVLILAASPNIASVVKTAVGIFTVNFATALPSANYLGCPSTAGQSDGATTGFTASHSFATPQTASAYVIIIKQSNALVDPLYAGVLFVG